MLQKILLKIKLKLHLTTEIKELRKRGVIVGDNTKIYDSFIDNGHGYLIEIGNNCILTHCTVLSHDASTQIKFKKSKIGIVKIGDNTFVGWGAIILPNVKIGDNCIIGAGCVVSKDIPDNSIVVGNPCKVVSNIDSFNKKHSEALMNNPVFSKYWKNKTDKEKQDEKNILIEKGIFGYDE